MEETGIRIPLGVSRSNRRIENLILELFEDEKFAGVEQRIENPCVTSSILVLGKNERFELPKRSVVSV
jgi:hypothetical protein